LAQKQLLKNFPSQTIMLMIYLGAMLAFLPFSDFSALLNLDLFHFAMLMFCALNTVFAYGFFAEALNHWDASRVSAINTTVPLVTVAAMKLCNWWFPDFLPSEDLGWLSIIGAVLVVAGSMTAALGRKKSV
jgi:drug/metabolite transporter (DMT)-like permease